MGKTDLTNQLAAATGLTKAKAADVLDAIFDPSTGIISKGVRSNGTVALQGFGSFKRTKRAARTGTKPGTSEKIQIPASKSVRFSAGRSFKAAINS